MITDVKKTVMSAAVGAALSVAAGAASADSLSSNGVTAELSVNNNWGAGYCAAVTLTNEGGSAVSGWQVSLDTNGSSINNLWSGNKSGNVVTGMGYNSTIAPGSSVSFGFCATSPSSSAIASLDNLSVDGGSAVSSVASSEASSVSSVEISSSSSSSESSSSVVSSSSSSSSSSEVSSASSVGVCEQVCNWYGSIHPLCENQSSGWGWENQQSCIGSATCSIQSGNGGIENSCASDPVSSSSSSIESSSSTSSSSSVVSSSSSSVVSSSSSSSSSSVISSSSSSVVSSSSSSSSSSSEPSNVIPNAASNGWPYCRTAGSDPDGDGWGWENSYSCIVFESAADPGPALNNDYCVIGGEQLTLCSTDGGSWGFENGEICLASTMCPGMGSATQAPLRDHLVNPNADSTANAVYDYLKSIWGNHMLSGQQDQTWADNIDQFQRVIDDTGKAPAIMGYDFMNYGLYWNGISGITQTEEAIQHWQRGGLVTFAWHWRDPNSPAGVVGEFYSKDTDFEIPLVNGELDKSSTSFANMESDIEMIAAELQKLEDAGVPVIWRPLHEASGGWFWWGRPDRSDDMPAAYAQVKLWQYLYDRLTNYYGLNNLIWIWNGQSAAWYPGDNYVDIVSHDLYDGRRNYESQVETYNAARSYSAEVKLVAMSENSNIPDPDLMEADGAWWLYFCVWNDGNTQAGVSSDGNFWTGEYYNTNAHKYHVYNHDLVITLDELPEF